MAAFLCANLLVFAFELIGLHKVYGEVGNMWLIYYTQLSNIFLLGAAFINITGAVGCLASGNESNLPMWAWRIFHAAVSATTVTFLVVPPEIAELVIFVLLGMPRLVDQPLEAASIL